MLTCLPSTQTLRETGKCPILQSFYTVNDQQDFGLLTLQEKYKEVKARNSQLLKMLQQGESELSPPSFHCFYFYRGLVLIFLMLHVTCNLSPSVKDKAEILLQVEELLHIKEELSSQVS